jgi:hypothetical protein
MEALDVLRDDDLAEHVEVDESFSS